MPRRSLGFSALQRAENSSIAFGILEPFDFDRVSVLFSEPKIPQCKTSSPPTKPPCCFSALQRAENSSIWEKHRKPDHVESVSVLFSEPKIPQCLLAEVPRGGKTCFSALQRAENSSISTRSSQRCDCGLFQCSSASRKFLNLGCRRVDGASPQSGFSALQRAENSSIRAPTCGSMNLFRFSALQRAENSSMSDPDQRAVHTHNVSVLFSEPKIPQSG